MDPNKKVLLVDDDSVYIFILTRLLRKHSPLVEVVSAKEGTEALAMLKRDAEMGALPQVIITDIEMPGMNGLDFIKELAKLGLVDYRHTKVILNSGKASYSNLNWPAEVPSVAFFPKPLTLETLAGIVGYV
ncbi:response regulator [Rufibacter ruber]|uniref:response regulator n=1 Tax=Rufibacter ruber TaxID=1783499 RepID=UPI00083731BD|nr:response regulator [Rufibacter ruber]